MVHKTLIESKTLMKCLITLSIYNDCLRMNEWLFAKLV